MLECRAHHALDHVSAPVQLEIREHPLERLSGAHREILVPDEQRPRLPALPSIDKPPGPDPDVADIVFVRFEQIASELDGSTLVVEREDGADQVAEIADEDDLLRFRVEIQRNAGQVVRLELLDEEL